MMFEPDNIAIDTNNSDVGRCGREQSGGGRGRCHCLDAKYPGELGIETPDTGDQEGADITISAISLLPGTRPPL